MNKERKKIHLINDLPHIYELEDTIEFCNKYNHLYILGNGEIEQYLLKYFDMCKINIEGFVVIKEEEKKSDYSGVYRHLPISLFDEIKDLESLGIIVGTTEKFYHRIIPFFRKIGFTDYFAMTEYNRMGIVGQVRPRSREEFTIEISLADHCNLSCQMCDHFSQLSDEWFPKYEQLCSDLKRMGELFEHKIAAISFLGGEPTLNPYLIDYLKVAREEFPEAEIIILTNGIKLLEWENSQSGNLWEVCSKLNIHIMITVYPINIPYEKIENKGNEYNVKVEMSSNIHGVELTKITKISDKHTLDLTGSIPTYYSVNCLYFNKFTVLKDGRLYMCPIAAHSNIFNKAFGQNLEITKKDYIDIYKANSWLEIVNFSSDCVPFCRYCDLKHWYHHSNWKTSSKKIEEYV